MIGYGNQGRAQALNLRDSGLEVLIGNREDDYAGQARKDGFSATVIRQAAAEADVVMLLLPDEVAPSVFEQEIAPSLIKGDVLVFASGYNITFGFIAPPPLVDVVLLAPRMIGAGVRDLYVAGHGFPSFIGIAQDCSGQAKAIALALAKGIGSTRAGVVEVTFAQEAELDLFTEQCFGPAFGHVLTTAVDLLIEEGYPPEAVLLELYMSGEFSYTLAKIAELGMIEQTELHSHTSQYGSMSRGMRFRIPELRARMREGLKEIRSGEFAQEWAREQEEGCPTLQMLKESARTLALYQLERELREALYDIPHPSLVQPIRGKPRQAFKGRKESGIGRAAEREAAQPAPTSPPDETGLVARALARLGKMTGFLGLGRQPDARPSTEALSGDKIEDVLRAFVVHAANDPALQKFASGRQVTTHYVLNDRKLEFYIRFQDGTVIGALGPPPSPAEVGLEMSTDVLDGMFTGRINAARAAMSGKLTFNGDTRLAMNIQRIQKDLTKLYRLARSEVTTRKA